MKHHAYCIIGTRKNVESVLRDAVGAERIGNPDYTEFLYQTLGADDARMIRNAGAGLSVSAGQSRIFVIEAGHITSEAQNILLKIFEEPPAGLKFFLIIPAESILLDTLRSRVEMIEPRAGYGESDTAKKFVAASYEKRREMIKKIDERSEARRLLDALEPIVRKNVLREILAVKKYLNDSGANHRLICEHIAAII